MNGFAGAPLLAETRWVAAAAVGSAPRRRYRPRTHPKYTANIHFAQIVSQLFRLLAKDNELESRHVNRSLHEVTLVHSAFRFIV